MTEHDKFLFRNRNRGVDVSQCYDEVLGKLISDEADRLGIPTDYENVNWCNKGALARLVCLNKSKTVNQIINDYDLKNTLVNPLPVKVLEVELSPEYYGDSLTKPIFTDTYYNSLTPHHITQDMTKRFPINQSLKQMKKLDLYNIPDADIITDIKRHNIDIEEFINNVINSSNSQIEILQNMTNGKFIDAPFDIRKVTYIPGATLDDYKMQLGDYNFEDVGSPEQFDMVDDETEYYINQIRQYELEEQRRLKIEQDMAFKEAMLIDSMKTCPESVSNSLLVPKETECFNNPPMLIDNVENCFTKSPNWDNRSQSSTKVRIRYNGQNTTFGYDPNEPMEYIITDLKFLMNSTGAVYLNGIFCQSDKTADSYLTPRNVYNLEFL